jgi:hypothetical protein
MSGKLGNIGNYNNDSNRKSQGSKISQCGWTRFDNVWLTETWEIESNQKKQSSIISRSRAEVETDVHAGRCDFMEAPGLPSEEKSHLKYLSKQPPVQCAAQPTN